MEQHKRLLFAIIEYLKEQKVSGCITDEAAEGLEVGIQCLETAYDLNTQDPQCALKYKTDVSLYDIFTSATTGSCVTENSLFNTKEASDEEKIEAAKFKTRGNDLMKEEKYMEALEAYTKAINLDQRNAVYYSNRAAALSKLDRHGESIDDCHRAVTIDPSYSKAYGRMGIAHTALNEDADAYECYRKACELDPGNETYKLNLQITQDKLKQNAEQTGASPGAGLFGNMDMSALLNNPNIMSMASQLMGNPQIQNVMSTLMSNNQPTDMSSFLSVGQQLASQMQQSNPELVEQLRNQFQSSNTTNTTNANQGDGNPPSSES